MSRFCQNYGNMLSFAKNIKFSHILNTISHCFFIQIQSIKPLTSKIILATWRRKLHSFPHFDPTLLAPPFLQLPFICNCYTSFYNGNTKICKNGHTKHFGNYDWIHINFKHIRYNMRNDNKTFGISKRSNFDKTPKEFTRN